MLKLIEKVKNAMEASEAAEAMNELMGHDRAKQGSMKECLSALLKAAGVNHAAEVYRAREGRVGGRRGYSFAFLSNGRRFLGFVDRMTMEVLRFRFQAALCLKKL